MAQTFPTHALTGVWIAEMVLIYSPETFTVPEGVLLLGSGIAGAIAPDLVMVPMFLLDKIRGKQPMTKQGPIIMALKEISHSIPIWVLAMLSVILFIPEGIFAQIGFMFTLTGLLGGILPDIPTHSEEQYKETDCTFLYPANMFFEALLGICRIRWPNDKFEYRYGHGILWPLKSFELWFNVILVVSGALALIHLIP